MSEMNRPGELAGGSSSQTHLARRPPKRRAVWVAGLALLVVLGALVLVSACVPTP